MVDHTIFQSYLKHCLRKWILAGPNLSTCDILVWYNTDFVR